MNKFRKLLSLALVLVMLFALSVPAFAIGTKKYRHYDTYMCLGDSIAAGCALSRQDGVEYPYDENIAKVADDPEAYLAYLTYMYAPDCDEVYRGYAPEPVPYAYHSIVANTLGAELIQGARSGMRAIELRYMLTGYYNEPDETYEWARTYFDMNADGQFQYEDLDAVNAQYGFNDNIRKADLISINLGSNDVISPSFISAFAKLSADTENEKLADIRAFLDKTGNFGAAFNKLVDVYDTMGKLADVVDTLRSEFSRTLELFKENYTAIVNAIYAMNPDVTVIGVGTYNIFQDFKLSKGSKLDISILAAPFVSDLNTFIDSFEMSHKGQYYYADVVGTETYEVIYDDPHMWDLWIFKVHPNLAGHAFMADRILDCMPAADNFFTPVINAYDNLISRLSKMSGELFSTFYRLLSGGFRFGGFRFGNISFGR